ncbi:unnamed protein product [Rotaria socialis]|uniref:Uncharacterized protein n=1 Tax=Rotaria socialis TaxID=392032 RepID=A0A818Y814_9BILA|nr:unnamed protein product [Rotaria socialis]
MNTNKAQSPRYIHDVDDKKIATIKFACNSEFRKFLENYFLEVALITVLIDNQYYLHPYKFQLDNSNITFKFVIIKTLQPGLTGLSSLPVFNATQFTNYRVNCEIIKDFKNAYKLSRARLAFSLGYSDDNNQLFRFTNTTVMLNEIIEKK